MIKVMHFITDTNVGGAGIWLINYLKSFDRKELDVSVVLPTGAAIKDKAEILGIQIYELNSIADKSFSLSSVTEIKKLIKAKKPDIVHTHASLSARIAAKMCGVPVVHTRHCLEGKKSFPKDVIYKFINNTLSDRVIGVSKAVTQNLEDDGIIKDKLSLVYNGITPLTKYDEDRKRQAKLSFDIPPDATVVGLVARLEDVKNPLLFVRTAKIVAKKHKDVCFLIVGEGSLRSDVTREAEPLQDRVRMAGYLPDIERAYNAMDILTLTSKSEALSIAILEGQSIELPVVSTDSGGPKEIITNGENGIITPNNDENALSDAITYLLENPEKRAMFGKKGRENVLTNFSSENMAQSIEKIYKSLLGKDDNK